MAPPQEPKAWYRIELFDEQLKNTQEKIKEIFIDS